MKELIDLYEKRAQTSATFVEMTTDNLRSIIQYVRRLEGELESSKIEPAEEGLLTYSNSNGGVTR